MCVIGNISTRTVWHWICSMCEHKKNAQRISLTCVGKKESHILQLVIATTKYHVLSSNTCLIMFSGILHVRIIFFLIKKKWVCCQFFCMLIFHCTDGRNESQIIQLLNNCDRNKCGIPNIFLHIDFYCALHISKTTEKWIC